MAGKKRRKDASPEERLKAILGICRRMNSEKDLRSLLDLIVQEAARLVDADRASIFLLDRDKRELWSWVALGTKELRFDARLGIAGAVAMTGETINVKDAPRDERFYPEIDAQTGYTTRNILAVPLRNYEGDIIGAFEALNKRQGAFTRSDEEIMHALASNAAISIDTAQLFEQLERQRDRLLEENTQLRREVKGKFATHNILGTSAPIQEVVRLIERISHSDVSVLITGESGTGKELVAKAIHHNSDRAARRMVTVNCAALPDTLLEAELFGIEKGVATGVEKRIGKFEEANGGTLFLDEIGDLSMTAQAKILRALQERAIERVGGRKMIPIDARILAATNRNLEEEIREGNFREDLYYRLKVVQIHTPPLRDVPADVPLLASHFLRRFCQEMKRELEWSDGALEALTRYGWPGNVRELENEVRRLVASVRAERIEPKDLSDSIRMGRARVGPRTGSLKDLVARKVEELESQLIREALDVCGNNQLRAAKHLGLSRQGLIKKMKRYGLRPERSRPRA